jgi:hypothetical protein
MAQKGFRQLVVEVQRRQCEPDAVAIFEGQG